MTNHFSTQAVHAGNDPPAPAGHPVSPSIHPLLIPTTTWMIFGGVA
jgi:hypothetical protein